MRIPALSLFAMAIVGAPTPAAAQMNMPPVNTYLQNFYVPSAGEMADAKIAEEERAKGTLPSAKAGSDADRATTRFDVDPAQRAQTLVAYGEQMRGASLREASYRIVAQGGLEGYAALEQYGPRVDYRDLADVLALWQMVAWNMAHGLGPFDNRDIVLPGLCIEARRTIAPQVTPMTAADRQRIADLLLADILVMMAATNVPAAAGGGDVGVRAMAQSLAEQRGMIVMNLGLGPSGLEPMP